jgi:hypothetical protein
MRNSYATTDGGIGNTTAKEKRGDARALDLLNGLGVGGFPLYPNFYDIVYETGRKR